MFYNNFQKKRVKKSDCGKTLMTDMLRVGGEFINKETKTEDVDYNCLKQMLKYMFAMPSTFMLSLKICWSWLPNIKWDNLFSFVESRKGRLLTRRLLRRMTCTKR